MTSDSQTYETSSSPPGDTLEPNSSQACEKCKDPAARDVSSLLTYIRRAHAALASPQLSLPDPALDVVEYLNNIRQSRKPWFFANIYGSIYKFNDGRMYRFDTLTASREIRINNFDRQFALYQAWMSGEEKDGLGIAIPYVQVNIDKDASVAIAYCHRSFLTLREGESIVMFKQLCQVDGIMNGYYIDANDNHNITASGQVLTLSGRSYRMRLTSNRVYLFIRKEDIFQNRIRTKKLVTSDSFTPDHERGVNTTTSTRRLLGVPTFVDVETEEDEFLAD